MGSNDVPKGSETTVVREDEPTITKGVVDNADEKREETKTDLDTTLSREYLPVNASFEQLAAQIPELAKMVGFNQRSDFHSLTLADHTKRVVANIEGDEFLKNNPRRELILLAGMLHDLGKLSEEGCQVHPKDPEKRQYVGHEDQSAIMAREVIDKYFGLGAEDKEFVATLTGLHASALNLISSFEASMKGKDKEMRGKKLKAFEKFVAKADEIPGDLNLEDKMRIIFALNRADKMAGFNEESDLSDPKVKTIKSKAEAQVAVLDEIEKALPALLTAIDARAQGKPNAGVKLVEGNYIYDDGVQQKKAAPQGVSGKVIGIIAKQYKELGLPEDQKGEFLKTLKEGGIPALGKAGFGRYIRVVKGVVENNRN
ncbi:HD domain-containing protein [Candidatus Peregrinibacteria bacterium]|nr:HD domain-containing protein [Candidatus Peregrinibacteria bacterium]